MISSQVFLLLFSSFDVDCIFSMSMFYSCHHSWSVPFLSIFSLTFCRPVAVCVPVKNTQALKGWEQDSKTISNYDEIWMCPKMGSGCSSSILIGFSIFSILLVVPPISGKPYKIYALNTYACICARNSQQAATIRIPSSERCAFQNDRYRNSNGDRNMSKPYLTGGIMES